MVDFHSHVLHDIDDGSKDLLTSLEILEDMYKRGTETLVLSPHYYPREQDEFPIYLDARELRFNELKRYCEGKEIPELKLGCEINLRTDISKFDGIEELCLEGTDYMLLEMPMFDPWEEWIYECIFSLTLKGIKPIIAHIDRYTPSKEELQALRDLKPVFQVNAEAFLSRSDRNLMLKYFNSDTLHILGSDTHGITKRPNQMPEAYAEIKNRFGEEYIAYIESNSRRVLENRPVHHGSALPKVPFMKTLF